MPLLQVSNLHATVADREILKGISLTINPGVYAQVNVSGGKLIMSAGVYIISGGGFAVTSSGSVTGAGVMIYNTGSNFPSSGGKTCFWKSCPISSGWPRPSNPAQAAASRTQNRVNFSSRCWYGSWLGQTH